MLWLSLAIAAEGALSVLVADLVPKVAMDVQRVTEVDVGTLPRVVLTTSQEEHHRLLADLQATGLTQETVEHATASFTAMYTPRDHTVRLFMDRIEALGGWATPSYRSSILHCLLAHEVAHAQTWQRRDRFESQAQWLMDEGHAQWVESAVCAQWPSAELAYRGMEASRARETPYGAATWEASRCVGATMEESGPPGVEQLLEGSPARLQWCADQRFTVPSYVPWPGPGIVASLDAAASVGPVPLEAFEDLPPGSRIMGGGVVEGTDGSITALFLDRPDELLTSSPYWAPARDLVPRRYVGDIAFGTSPDGTVWGVWPHNGLFRVSGLALDAAVEHFGDVSMRPTVPRDDAPPMPTDLVLAFAGEDGTGPIPVEAMVAFPRFPAALVGPGFAYNPESARTPAFTPLVNEPIVARPATRVVDFVRGGIETSVHQQSVAVWIVARDLERGQIVTHDDVQLVLYPEPYVPADTLRFGDDPIGLRMARDSGAGVLVRRERLAGLREPSGWILWWHPAASDGLLRAPSTEGPVITRIAEDLYPGLREAVSERLGVPLRSTLVVASSPLSPHGERRKATRPSPTTITLYWDALVDRHPHLFHTYPEHREALVRCALASSLAAEGARQATDGMPIDRRWTDAMARRVGEELCSDPVAHAWMVDAAPELEPFVRAVAPVLDLPKRKRARRLRALQTPTVDPGVSWPSDDAIRELCAEVGEPDPSIRTDGLAPKIRRPETLEHLEQLASLGKTREIVCGSLRIEAVDFLSAREFPVVADVEPVRQGPNGALYRIGDTWYAVSAAGVVQIIGDRQRGLEAGLSTWLR